jgi:hypothetical protein
LSAGWQSPPSRSTGYLAKTGDGVYQDDVLQKSLFLGLEPLFTLYRRPFTRNNFLSTLSNELKALGLRADDYSGHSFQKGAAQYAYTSGILDDQIQALGRWTSEVFRLYVATGTSVLYNLNHQFQTSSPAPLYLSVPPLSFNISYYYFGDGKAVPIRLPFF